MKEVSGEMRIFLSPHTSFFFFLLRHPLFLWISPEMPFVLQFDAMLSWMPLELIFGIVIVIINFKVPKND